MKTLTRNKNGYTIKVTPWSPTVEVYKAGKLVSAHTFSNHVAAVLAAKAI
jgi:hypothetical protein